MDVAVVSADRGTLVQRRALHETYHIPLGFRWPPSAGRRNVQGVHRAPATVSGGISKG